MAFPALQQYLDRLFSQPQAQTRVWADADGRAFGRFFHSTLTSAFQPIRILGSGELAGYEGFARSQADNEPGLCLWRLLDHAASDDESVELDRLCRILHAINFFRQREAVDRDLYLNVHARLLAAVDGNHGTAFRRVLKLLELPQQRIVLQLPLVVAQQDWLLNYVADNYRRNGFRIAANAVDALQALTLVDRVRPEAVKIDTRQTVHDGPALRLLEKCAALGIRVIFKRVESMETLDALQRIAVISGQALHVQGFLWDQPRMSLAQPLPTRTGTA